MENIERRDVGKIASEYCKVFPLMPSLTLARKIKMENPFLAQNLELIRNRVRYYRGQNGKTARNHSADKSCFIKQYDTFTEEFSSDAPPKSFAHEWTPYVCPESMQKTLLLADVHVPFHVNEAVEIAVKKAKEEKVDSVILDGDIFDFHELSPFARSMSDRIPYVTELELANWFLDYIHKKLPNADIKFKVASHEERLDRYISKNSSTLYHSDGMNFSSAIYAVQRGMTIIDQRRRIKYGKLNIIHGDELSNSAAIPVNPARSYFLACGSVVIGAHHHQSSMHGGADIEGNQNVSWSVGCLCELHPLWKRINKWNHGFSILEKDNSGNFEVMNYRIIKGKLYT